jgi:membrane fusion protein, multidrug efflux system
MTSQPESTNAPTPRAPASARRRRLTIGATIALLAISGALILGISHGAAADRAPAPAAPPAPRVTVAPVQERLLTEFQELTGRVDALETVELRARVSGHMEAVHFQAGQLVHAGDVLFTIDPRWYRATVDLATAEVERARVRAEIAERESRRADDLLAQKAISIEEADARRSSHAEAQAALLSAEATLTTARLDLENTEVRAPIDGRVSRAFVTPGNLVSGAPGNATTLARIVSTGDAYVYADVDENTVLTFNRLRREGRLPLENGRVPVDLQLADEDGFPHRGYIESTDNRLDPATGSLALRMVFANPDDELVPGLFARVRVPVSAPQQTLLVSDRAIGTDQNQKFVLTVDAGLEAGDTVVVNGLQRVRPGMTIEPELATASVPLLVPVTSVASR